MRRHRLTLAIIFGLIVLTVTAFSQVVRCDFADFDDNDYVFENAEVLGGLKATNIAWAFTTFHAGNWHPLTWLSLQLDATLFGLNPAGYHLTNLILHAGSVVLLFLVLCGMTGAVWRSAAVAAFFAVHPLHVESVAWIAERKDVLSGFFWMLTMGAYLVYVRRPGPWRYLLVVLALVLGLMAKQMLVTLPCVFCLLDYWPLRRLSWSPADPAPDGTETPRFPKVSLRLLVWEKLPLFILVALASVATYSVQPVQTSTYMGLTLDIRVMNALTAYVAYLAKTFWPVGLSPYYPHPRGGVVVWQAVAAGGLLLAISLLALLQGRRRPYLAVGWLWYLGTLVPVVGLIQVGGQAMADRYTYLPHIGLFLMLAWGLPDLLARWCRPEVVLAPVLGVLLAACVGCTILQVNYWRDGLTLWEHAIAVNPHNAMAYNCLSAEYANRDRWDDALDCSRKAVQNDPDVIRYRARLVLILRRMGKNEESNDVLNEMVHRADDPGVIGP